MGAPSVAAPSPREVILAAHALTFIYGGTRAPALRNVSLAVERGEFLGIVGPTGAGKTTLLQCLAGVIPFYTHGERAGTVEVLSKEVLEYGSLVELSRTVGLVLQDPEAQLFNLRVRDELAWGLENRGVPPPEILTSVERTAALFGIENLLDRITYTLSGGEKQRTVVAAVFAQQPEIMLLDEPTSELDPIGTDMVFEAASVLARQGVTVVMVEHKVEQLARHADRLAILEHGEIVALGGVREVLEGEAVAGLPDYRPQVLQLGEELKATGFAADPLPLTVDEAVAMYRRLVPAEMPYAAAH